jgi:uncharacterized protein
MLAASDPLLDRVSEAARREPGLELLVLFGSRARGDAHERSDWDFGYLAGERFDPDRFLATLVGLLDVDRIDLVDLSRAGGLLRYRAAGDGVPLFESEEGAFAKFWFDAVSFWCDAQPILSAGYEAILERLSP